MAMNIKLIPQDVKNEVNILIDKFNAGFINLIDESMLPREAAVQSTNLMQVQDGRWQTRWGSAYFGIAAANADIDGAFEYVKSDKTTELIKITNGKAYKSTDLGASWTEITGATFTAGHQCYFLQSESKLYITNGTDNLTIYNGTALSRYTALATPGKPTLARTTLTAGSYNAYYQIVAVNSVGFTPAGAEEVITVNRPRDQWSGTDKIALSWTAVTGAIRYEIYYSDESGNEVFLASTTTNAYDDTGTAVPNPYVESPVDNTTAGPKIVSMCLSGNRIWGTKDGDNAYRVYAGGVGQFQGFFSPFYGGVWVDLEKGGREFPYVVKHFKDGKGGANVTVLTSDPQGRGSTWQIPLDSMTIGDVTFVVPNPIKVTGSQGCNAVNGAVLARDNLYFTNSKGFQSTGSKPSLLNVLATDEVSDNIRPFWNALSQSGMEDACVYYYDAKIFISLPYGSTTNSIIIVLDLERKNWSCYWTIGVKQFLEHTKSGKTYLLGVPVSGSRLIQFGEDIQGDLGVAFNTSYLSGLIYFGNDHTKWAKIKNVYFEIGRLKGTIKVEVLGTDKNKGYISLATKTITDNSFKTDVGFSSERFSNFRFSGSTKVPTAYAKATIRKKLKVNKLINNIAFHVFSTDLAAKYALLSIQAKGYVVPTRDPETWN